MTNMPDVIFVSKVENPNGVVDWIVEEKWNEDDECYVKWSVAHKTFFERVVENWDNPNFNNNVNNAVFDFLRRVVNVLDS